MTTSVKNIEIIDASYTVMGAFIEFKRIGDHARFYFLLTHGERTQYRAYDRNRKEYGDWTMSSYDGLVEILNHCSSAWTYSTFLASWEAWCAGRKHGRAEVFEDQSTEIAK